ncbi:hypothetical protein CYLTODRAFT_424379 [Cylindrobasidium torrendii FP15055 ss-10]|uniref:Malate dehydrogenase n=1 Tax=Cylindrobasidium torrendii FP15055 ss-10 TaxID=1314674 RepID=A0A0D7B4G8_9AGAR|nr:hypothetical protein CYLTODRAFT_424379 [Cylindrobasidium torrendii FP15055 ss-10]
MLSFFTVLASTTLAVLAAPARRTDSYSAQCDLSSIVLKVDDPNFNFTFPDVAPRYVTLGLGTQNYTCSDEGKYVSSGARAALFDTSCLAANYPDAFSVATSTVFEVISQDPEGFVDAFVGGDWQQWAENTTYYEDAPVSLVGEHFFIKNADGSISPRFQVNDEFVVGKLAQSTPAPDATKAVPWLELDGIDGTLANLFFRTNTQGGVAPTSCDPHVDTEEIVVPYVAGYDFYHI